jgi:hypothetical protein
MVQEDFAQTSKRSPFALTAIVCAVFISFALFVVYLAARRFFSNRRIEKTNVSSSVRVSPAEIQAFENEPVPKGSVAVISGTLRNISPEDLTGLSVEIELRRRDDGALEQIELPVEPRDLAASAEGRYATMIPARVYSGVRLSRIKSAARATDITFKSAPGERRPLEPPPSPKTIIVNRPSASRKKGDEFLNTPDNPARLP